MIKLQHMTVIFLVIMIPIVLVLSYYISIQIDTINLQTQYNTKLNDATHDAMEAFQLNTRNNEYSSVADSLKRDVAAAINTFYISLASNIDMSGTARVELQPYIPAILCTMYDGYYISSPTKTQAASDDVEEVLKQYTYYTARYIGTNTDVTINYSLDSYISIYGRIKGTYVARSGYLIQYGTNGLTSINGVDIDQYSVYNPYYNGSGTEYYGTGSYKIKNGAIFDSSGNSVGTNQVIYKGETIGSENTGIVKKNDQNQYVNEPSNNDALQYFIDAYEFSKYMQEIDLNGAIENADRIQINNEIIWEETDSDGIDNVIHKLSNIFDIQNNDPETLTSPFVSHKRDIIRYSIENNLKIAFNNFVGGGTYEYQLPKLTEEDWKKIYNNVSIVAFMQGIQVGSKMYNNYSVVTSTGNDEYIAPEELYFIEGNQYHRITCSVATTLNKGYRSSMFIPQNIINGSNVSDVAGLSGYILRDIGGQELYADYQCIINADYESIYNDAGELAGNIALGKKNIYYTTLARERYGLAQRKATKILNATY